MSWGGLVSVTLAALGGVLVGSVWSRWRAPSSAERDERTVQSTTRLANAWVDAQTEHVAVYSDHRILPWFVEGDQVADRVLDGFEYDGENLGAFVGACAILGAIKEAEEDILSIGARWSWECSFIQSAVIGAIHRVMVDYVDEVVEDEIMSTAERLRPFSEDLSQLVAETWGFTLPDFDDDDEERKG